MKLRFSTTLSLIGTLLCVFSLIASAQSKPSTPLVVSPEEVPRILKTIPSYTRFSYSGLAFFNGKLYASSNFGLLEYESGRLSRLYKWDSRDDVISGPWLDSSHHSLWMLHEGLRKLIRYDGNSWVKMKRAEPKEGLTTGDVLQGYRGIASSNNFWLEGAGQAWRSVNDGNGWLLEPGFGASGSVAMIIPMEDRILYIKRNKSVFSWALDKEPTSAQSDSVYYFDNQWKQVPNRSGEKYYAEQTVSVGNRGFLRTRQGRLLLVTQTEVTLLESPGVCEALAVTSSGNLLASFVNLRVYEYTNTWRKLFSSPYPQTEGKHWAYLTESRGQVAFAITAKPQMIGDNQWKYEGQTTLWLSTANELKVLPLAAP